MTNVGTPKYRAIIPGIVKYPITRFISKIPARIFNIPVPIAPSVPVKDDHITESISLTIIIFLLLS